MRRPRQPFSGFGNALKTSWNTLWTEPRTIFPILYQSLLLALFLLAAGVILYAIVHAQGSVISGEDPQALATAVSGLIFTLAGTALLFLILFFFLLAHTFSVYATMMNELATRRTVSIKESFKKARTIYWRSYRLIITKTLIQFLILGTIGAALAGILLFPKGTSGFAPESHPVITLALIILFLVFSFLLGAWFLFTGPLLARTKWGAWKMIKEAFTILFKDASFAWPAYLITIAVSFGASMITSSFTTMLSTIGASWVGDLISIIAGFLAASWTGLFAFTIFNKRYGKKELS